MFLVTEFIAILGANLVFTKALGTSTLFASADSWKNLVRTSFIITLFAVCSSAGAYFTDLCTGGSLENFRLVFYVLETGLVYILFLALSFFVSRKNFDRTKKYIHLSAYNCAVMGTVLTVSGSVPEGSLWGYILSGLETGAGFIIASLTMSVAYRRLNSVRVPQSFRGFPAMLIYIGIISMAVYAVS